VAGYNVRGVLIGSCFEKLCLEGDQVSSLDKMKCIEKFCYLGDLIGASGGAEEASRVRLRCV